MLILKTLDRKIIAVIALLAVILLSIKEPLPDFSKIINRQINLNKATSYNCIAEKIPMDARVYFFGNPSEDPIKSSTIALYYRSQFFLSPRLIHLTGSLKQIQDEDMGNWFIGTNLEAEQVKNLDEEFQLNLITNCGALNLFQHSSGP